LTQPKNTDRSGLTSGSMPACGVREPVFEISTLTVSSCVY